MNSLPCPPKYSQIEILRAKIQYWLARADKETNPKKRFEFLVTVQNPSRRLRLKDHGFTKWWSAVSFASLCAVPLVACAIYMQSSKKSTFYQYPDNYLRIVQNLDPCEADGTCGYRRLVQVVVKGVPNPETVMQFCQKPRFEQGHTLNWIKVIDNGSCWEVDGWSPLTDSTGRDSLAGNCNPDFSQAKDAGHVACEGGKARF